MAKHIHILPTRLGGGVISAGHGYSIDHVQRGADASGHDHEIFVGGAHDKRKNPVPQETKLKFARKLFPKANLVPGKNLIDHIGGYHARGYSHVHIHGDEDRIKEMRNTIGKRILTGSIPKDLKFHYHPIKRIEHGGEPITGTALRGMVKRGEKERYIAHLPASHKKHPGLADDLYDTVKKHLGEAYMDYDARFEALMEKEKGVYDEDDLADDTFRRKFRRKRDLDEARKGKNNVSDEGDTGDNGIIFQLRKAKNLRGQFEIKWGDGSKDHLPLSDINAALLKINRVVNSSGPGSYGLDKHKFVHNLGKSKNMFYKMLGEGVVKKKIDLVKVTPIQPADLSKSSKVGPYQKFPMGSDLPIQPVYERRQALFRTQKRSAGTTGTIYRKIKGKVHPMRSPYLSLVAANTRKGDFAFNRLLAQLARKSTTRRYGVTKKSGSIRGLHVQTSPKARIYRAGKTHPTIKRVIHEMDQHERGEKEIKKGEKDIKKGKEEVALGKKDLKKPDRNDIKKGKDKNQVDRKDPDLDTKKTKNEKIPPGHMEITDKPLTPDPVSVEAGVVKKDSFKVDQAAKLHENKTLAATIRSLSEQPQAPASKNLAATIRSMYGK